jgi:hypothetical protein
VQGPCDTVSAGKSKKGVKMTVTIEDLREKRRSEYFEIKKAKFEGELIPEALEAIQKEAFEGADQMSEMCKGTDKIRVEKAARIAAGEPPEIPPMTGGPIDRSAAFPKAGLYRTICMRGD